MDSICSFCCFVSIIFYYYFTIYWYIYIYYILYADIMCIYIYTHHIHIISIYKMHRHCIVYYLWIQCFFGKQPVTTGMHIQVLKNGHGHGAQEKWDPTSITSCNGDWWMLDSMRLADHCQTFLDLMQLADIQRTMKFINVCTEELWPGTVPLVLFLSSIDINLLLYFMAWIPCPSLNNHKN